MRDDVSGYYRSLGVTHTASIEEIKAAYCQLAKQHHPDGGANDGGAKFRAVNDAYFVLGDLERRTAYDQACAELGEAQNPPQIAPLRCCACDKVTAQPRHLTFWRVLSLALATTRTPVQGIFCAPCASRESLKSTAFTASFGWWGVPWGPIWTVVEGLKNAFGGVRDRVRDDLCMWHNAVAFASNGQTALGYGLAERLLSSSDLRVRTDAAKLVTYLRDQGFVPIGHLNDAWRRSSFGVALRVGMICAVPVSAAVLANGVDWNATSDGLEPTQVALYSPPPIEPAAASAALAEPVPAQVLPVATCATKPDNGDILRGAKRLTDTGHRLTI